MSDKTVIIFSFPRNVILDISLAEKMGKIQDDFKDLPGVQIFSVVGGTAEKIVKTLEEDPDKEPSGLVLHAMRELDLAGNDEDFNASIIAAVEGFVSYGHSGGSHSVAVELLEDILNYRNLTPLTDNSKEWMSVEMGDTPCWQSVRNPAAFSNDEGKTYYLLSEGANATKPEPIHQSAHIFEEGEIDSGG